MYNLRQITNEAGGAIMLSPNALQILDSLRAYDRTRDKNFELLTF